MLKQLFSTLYVATQSIGSDTDDAWSIDWQEIWPDIKNRVYAVSFDKYWQIPENEIEDAIRLSGSNDSPRIRNRAVENLKEHHLVAWEDEKVRFEGIYTKKKMGHAYWHYNSPSQLRVIETDDLKRSTNSSMTLIPLKNLCSRYVRMTCTRHKRNDGGLTTDSSSERYFKITNSFSTIDQCQLDLLDVNRSPEGTCGLSLTLMDAARMRSLQNSSGYFFSVQSTFES